MIEELIARVFATRNAVHLAHWKEEGIGAYARHMALGDLYDQLIEDIDEIVECYIGGVGDLSDLPDVSVPSNVNILDHLINEADWITNNTSEISGDVRSIDSLIDILVAHYLRGIYKLTKFK